ncbi:hypothetical protein [Nodularia sp. NIES-3585]|nr:hypothetical protein [Nodularia sp. NIES-3585]GAX38903.1 hypothetical protein NIES3585_49550 [Nodularia sp. NIES-3585]
MVSFTDCDQEAGGEVSAVGVGGGGWVASEVEKLARQLSNNASNL